MNLLWATRVLITCSVATGRVDQPTDEELMLSALHGDRLAIASLVERYYAPLFGYLFRLTDGDRSAAEDLIQDTFTRLLSPRTYTTGRPLKPWLYAIATNLVRDHYRLLSRRDDTMLESAELLADSADPIQDVVASEDARAVQAAIRSLGHEQRAAVVLRFYQDLSLAEIGQALGIPVGTVKSRLSLGARKLRQLLQPLRKEANR